jgi:hypothetical protein
MTYDKAKQLYNASGLLEKSIQTTQLKATELLDTFVDLAVK